MNYIVIVAAVSMTIVIVFDPGGERNRSNASNLILAESGERNRSNTFSGNCQKGRRNRSGLCPEDEGGEWPARAGR